jgi:hypothetical protein
MGIVSEAAGALRFPRCCKSSFMNLVVKGTPVDSPAEAAWDDDPSAVRGHNLRLQNRVWAQ